MTPENTTVTVQLDVGYDPRRSMLGQISADLAERFEHTCETKMHRPFRTGPAWWTTAVRVFDHAAEPLGFQSLAASFDQIGEAMDAFDDGRITAEELHAVIREQVGERNTSR